MGKTAKAQLSPPWGDVFWPACASISPIPAGTMEGKSRYVMVAAIQPAMRATTLHTLMG